MNRNIDIKAHIYYSLYILIIEISQSNVISLKKRKPCVVVLEIKRFPHAGRHLIYKAENAFITARVLIVHKK